MRVRGVEDSSNAKALPAGRALLFGRRRRREDFAPGGLWLRFWLRSFLGFFAAFVFASHGCKFATDGRFVEEGFVQDSCFSVDEVSTSCSARKQSPARKMEFPTGSKAGCQGSPMLCSIPGLGADWLFRNCPNMSACSPAEIDFFFLNSS